MKSDEPIQLTTVSEIARQAKVCGMTLARKVKAIGLKPDGVLLCGTRSIPLFVKSAAPMILKLTQ